MTWIDVQLFDLNEQLFFGKPLGVMGAEQFVLIQETLPWSAHRAILPRDASALRQRIWNGTEEGFRALGKASLQQLGLEPTFVQAAGFRRGGACHEYQREQNVPRVRRRGRWRQESTIERYLQDAIHFQLLRGIPSNRRKQIVDLACLAKDVFTEAEAETEPASPSPPAWNGRVS